jgi:hypothetical protein
MKLLTSIVFVLASSIAVVTGIESTDEFVPFPQNQEPIEEPIEKLIEEPVEEPVEYQESEYQPYSNDADEYLDESY